MVDVCRDDHAAASYFIAHQFGRDFLAVGDVAHLLGSRALTGVMHLGEVAVFVFGFALGQPCRPRFQNRIQTIAVRAVCGLAIACGHFRLYHPSRSVVLKLYAACGYSWFSSATFLTT